MKNISILLVFFLIFSCQRAINKDNYKVIDFESANAQINIANLGYPHFQKNSKTSINESEISLLFGILEDGINNYNVENKNHQIYINEYRFFIIPVLYDENEEIFLIFSYRFNPQNEWMELRDWFQVFDGGNSYFRSKINLTKKTGGKIIPNGEA